MYARLLKRPLDILLSLAFILMFFWLFIIISIPYMFMAEKAIFFSQERIGKDEQIFMLYKFRTLRSTGTLAERKFWWGSALRFTSLDELPQLIHVLRGEMSLIGPRPLLAEYLPLFSKEQRVRHQIRPGITGWAQVNGRNSIPWLEKFQYDIFYVKNISFRLDCRIVVRTIRLLLSFRKDVSLAEEKFSVKGDA